MSTIKRGRGDQNLIYQESSTKESDSKLFLVKHDDFKRSLLNLYQKNTSKEFHIEVFIFIRDEDAGRETVLLRNEIANDTVGLLNMVFDDLKFWGKKFREYELKFSLQYSAINDKEAMFMGLKGKGTLLHSFCNDVMSRINKIMYKDENYRPSNAAEQSLNEFFIRRLGKIPSKTETSNNAVLTNLKRKRIVYTSGIKHYPFT